MVLMFKSSSRSKRLEELIEQGHSGKQEEDEGDRVAIV